MKLLVVSHSCATTVNQRVYEKVRELTGWDVTIAVPARWRDEFGNVLDPNGSSADGVRVLKVPVANNGSIILHIYRQCWSNFIRRERFDIVYVNHEAYAPATAQVVWACRRAGRVPVGFYSCQNIQKKYPVPFRWLEFLVYRQSRFAFPITKTVADVLRRKGFQGDITVCPLPFDPAMYHPRPKQDCPRELVRSEGEVLLGFVGRIVEAKGLRTLALALCHLRQLRWKLLVIGTGPFEKAFSEILEAGGVHDRLIRIGYVPHHETPRYIAGMDVLVLPSETQANWKEQFGRVIPEALACGVPVVGSDSGEIPLLVRESGGGLVFAERDPHALADALRRMIESVEMRSHCGNVGREWALREVSLDRVANRMAEALGRAVGSGNAAP